MRTANSDLQLIYSNDGEAPIALSLGYGMCAEHEHGIDQMKRLLGCERDADGIEKGRLDPASAAARMSIAEVTSKKKSPDHFIIEMTYMKFPADQLIKRVSAWEIPEKNSEPGYSSQWDESSFRLVATDPAAIGFLKDFHAAALSGNAAVTPINLSGNNPFGRSSIALVIVDRMPESVLENMRLADVDNRLLQLQFKELELEKTCKDMGIRLGAISPSRIDAEKMAVLETDFPFNLWLNSWSDAIKSSWYSVEELRDKLIEISPNQELVDRIEIARQIHLDADAAGRLGKDADVPEVAR